MYFHRSKSTESIWYKSSFELLKLRNASVVQRSNVSFMRSTLFNFSQIPFLLHNFPLILDISEVFLVHSSSALGCSLRFVCNLKQTLILRQPNNFQALVEPRTVTQPAEFLWGWQAGIKEEEEEEEEEVKAGRSAGDSEGIVTNPKKQRWGASNEISLQERKRNTAEREKKQQPWSLGEEEGENIDEEKMKVDEWKEQPVCPGKTTRDGAHPADIFHRLDAASQLKWTGSIYTQELSEPSHLLGLQFHPVPAALIKIPHCPPCYLLT